MLNRENRGGTVSAMRLYDRSNNRLYINAEGRARFLIAARQAAFPIRVFCQTLLYTGCRLSEARELTSAALQLDARLIGFRSLKKRQQHHIREVPIPQLLADSLAELQGRRSSKSPDAVKASTPIWGQDGMIVDRTTAYRWVKSVMRQAQINGAQACPKGLRHGYGIHAIRSGVQLNMLQKWMGHASMSTTAIYANAIGAEELEIADRMWE